jgi:hypothetical protein
VAGAQQLGEDRPAVAIGEHRVKQDKVVLAGRGQVEPVLAVLRDVDHKPALREALEEGRGLRLVFDDQDPHG